MTSKGRRYAPFKRKTLAMAWEGWYAIWELVHRVLPLMYPKMTETQRRALAEETLTEFVDAGLAFLQRFHFTGEKWIDVQRDEVEAVLLNDAYWQPAEIDQWQIRFLTTPAGNNVFPGPPQRPDGWINTDWWIPKGKHITREPTLHWTLRHVRQYIDRRQSVYDFYQPAPLIVRFYKSYLDDPLHRISYFWREIDSYGWRVIRWGSGDEERYFRSYVGLWLEALKLTKREWRQVVRKKGRPLEASGTDWNLD